MNNLMIMKEAQLPIIMVGGNKKNNCPLIELTCSMVIGV